MKRYYKILTKNFLQKEYIFKRHSIRNISDKLNINHQTILNYLNKFNIKVRNKSKAVIGIYNSSYIDGRSNKINKCINCGKNLAQQSYYRQSKRCENCYYLFNRGKNHSCWKGGKSFEPYPLGWTKTFKEQIRYRDGYKCQLCGCSEVENNKRLDIHHIDYDKNNLKLDNLIALCRICHMKTNYNRNYWKNKIQIKMEEINGR